MWVSLLNGRNPFSMTKVICRRSLIIFDVSLTEKPKSFYTVISTWWLIVVTYQNILITGSKAIRITVERKCLSVLFVLWERLGKLTRKKCSIKAVYIKSRAKKMERKIYTTFYQRDIFFMRYFLRLSYFKKFPHNAEIRYWVILEIGLLRSSHIEITISVNGYALFVSLFLNIFLNQIREQEKTANKCQMFWNLTKRSSSEK